MLSSNNRSNLLIIGIYSDKMSSAPNAMENNNALSQSMDSVNTGLPEEEVRNPIHHQQNKWYPQRCLLAYFEATLDFCRTKLLAHNNIRSQICYCCFPDILTPLGVPFILLAIVQVQNLYFYFFLSELE